MALDFRMPQGVPVPQLRWPRDGRETELPICKESLLLFVVKRLRASDAVVVIGI